MPTNEFRSTQPLATPVAARLAPCVRGLLDRPELLLSWSDLSAGPLHLNFPECVAENIERLSTPFAAAGLTSRIFVAHKPVRSPALIRALLPTSADIDVASLGELTNALAAGFSGERIEATGPKNELFLVTALMHRTLISIDSLAELRKIIELLECNHSIPRPAKVLLRVQVIGEETRNLIHRPSRFGLDSQSFRAAVELCREWKNLVSLAGLHHHSEEQFPPLRASFVAGLIAETMKLISEGFAPSMINCGGGFRIQEAANQAEVASFFSTLESALSAGAPLPTWKDHGFGLSRTKDGRVVGQEVALARFRVPSPVETIEQILSYEIPGHRTIAAFALENEIELAIEPGAAAWSDCGLSMLRVETVRTGSGGAPMVTVNGNYTTLASASRDPFFDPLLISRRSKKPSTRGDDHWSGYVVGNLCKETDFISRRMIYLAETPEPGDLLVYPNTAAYLAGFEEASPLLQPIGLRYAAVGLKGGAPRLVSEDSYTPFTRHPIGSPPH